MTTQSPFSFLQNALSGLSKSVTLPPWLIEESQRRMVLLANHVLQQEPEAQRRLMTQKGKSVFISWRQFNGQVRITPAGLLDLDRPNTPSDLLLEVSETSVAQLTKGAINGEKPPIRIAGDVALASELNWVIDNVRWDLEDDLSRLIGDTAAHQVARVCSRIATELRRFAQGALNQFQSRGAATDAPSPASGTTYSTPPQAHTASRSDLPSAD